MVARSTEMSERRRRPKAVVVYRALPQYRRRFYELLRERLDEAGVEFVLIYGQPGRADAAKLDTVELPWAHRIRNRVVKIGAREAYWQPCLGLLRDTDLVIVEQASKLLVNYVLFAYQLAGKNKLAFWGHGKNFQQRQASGIAEAVKRYMSRRVHWWFAYNDLSARVVEEIGYPEGRITVVQNALDTQELVRARSEIRAERLDAIRQELGVKGDNVCIYTGAMYAEKRIDLLLEICDMVREDVPDFEMIFVGAGPDDRLVKEAAARHGWIHYTGPKFDEEKVPYFMISKLLLMPAAVGLAVLDAFALEVPLVTTDGPFHGPEIGYLVDGVNGLLLDDPDDPAAYAAAVKRLLRDDAARERLVAGCRESANLYTVEEMVERFAGGVLRALDAGATDGARERGGP